MTDDEFAAAIQGGDPNAMHEFYETFKAPVERSASFFLGDDPDMKGAVADTFQAAFAEIRAKGKPDLPMKPWLSILAVQRCFPLMDKRRREFEAQSVELEALARRVPVLQEITQDDHERVNFMVRGEIDDIPEPHKQMLSMYELDGLNVLEISKRLGVAWVTVLTRMINARQVLQERVRHQFKTA